MRNVILQHGSQNSLPCVAEPKPQFPWPPEPIILCVTPTTLKHIIPCLEGTFKQNSKVSYKTIQYCTISFLHMVTWALFFAYGFISYLSYKNLIRFNKTRSSNICTKKIALNAWSFYFRSRNRPTYF